MIKLDSFEDLTAALLLSRASSPGRFAGTITYHDSCAGLREMGRENVSMRYRKSGVQSSS